MKTSEKVILSACIFLLTFTAISAICLKAFFSMDTYCFDKDIRAAYAGSIDRVFCGTSYAQGAYDPQVIDSVLGCSSYNLGGPAMPLTATAEILKTELERNPVKVVYIDVSLNSFSRESSSGEGEMYAFPRFEGLSGKVSFLKRVDSPTYPKIYSNMMIQGLVSIKGALRRGELFSAFKPYDFLSSPYYEDKGVYSDEVGVSVVIPEDEIDAQYNSVICSTYVDRNYCTLYDEIIDMCHEHGARVVFVVVPLSEAYTWIFANADSVMGWFIDYCKEHDCEYYDFCLLKERHQLLSDEYDYLDRSHMSRPAAGKYSRRFAEVMALAESGEDVSDLFYSSYEEYKAANPYWLYYTENTAPVSGSDAA